MRADRCAYIRSSQHTLYGDSHLSAEGRRHSVVSNAFIQFAEMARRIDNQQCFAAAS